MADADYSDVKRQASEWPDEYLECRTYGHDWRPSRATWNPAYRYYLVTQLCPRCLSERRIDMNDRGHVVNQWIDYAEGYLSKGLGRIVGDGRDALRLATIERTFQVRRLSKAEGTLAAPSRQRTLDGLGVEKAS